jgi:ABC-type multidrug transport system fused ATPase/permease subunit
MVQQEEEVLGKAYDGRLMRRLLGYLLPYRAAVAVSLAAIIAQSVLQLAQPYLIKIAIDRYIASGDLSGLNTIALAFLAILALSFAFEFLQTYTLQMTGQRIMFDLRTQIYDRFQKLDLQFYDRNPVGRMMTRVTTDVDVLNDLFTSGLVSVFGDVFTLAGIMIVMLAMNWKLAIVAFSVLPLIGSAAASATPTAPSASGSHASTPSCRSTSRGWPPCSSSGRRAAPSAASTRSTGGTAMPTSPRSSTTPCSTRRSKSSARSPRPSSSGWAAATCSPRR